MRSTFESVRLAELGTDIAVDPTSAAIEPPILGHEAYGACVLIGSQIGRDSMPTESRLRRSRSRESSLSHRKEVSQPDDEDPGTGSGNEKRPSSESRVR